MKLIISFLYPPHTGTGYNLLDPGVKSCPEGLEDIVEVAECKQACNYLGIQLSDKQFKRGRPCFKSKRNVCNQRGGSNTNNRLICKQEGNVMLKSI